MTRFAADTSVPVAKSKAEIEAILERYGAEQFMSGWNADCAVIGFTICIEDDQIRQIRFNLPMPDKLAREIVKAQHLGVGKVALVRLALEAGEQRGMKLQRERDAVIARQLADQILGDGEFDAAQRIALMTLEQAIRTQA